MDIIFNEINKLVIPYLIMVLIVLVVDLFKILILNSKCWDLKISVWNEVANVFFFSYLILVLYLTLYLSFGDSNTVREINFVPFRFLKDFAGHKSLMIYNIGGNIALFVPFGVLFPRVCQKRGKALTIPLAILLTFAIEIIQYFIGRSSDIDDIMTNIVGAIIGFVIYLIIHFINLKIQNKKAM